MMDYDSVNKKLILYISYDQIQIIRFCSIYAFVERNKQSFVQD